ncbi:hypothetical protein HA402_006287 [Bradysia odoriphaga]|nr:hypothetical protein HA402_006287 [Bradysia odoriphaga]
MRNKRSVQGYFCNNPASADTKENDQHAGKINFNSEQKNSLRDHNNDINNSVNADMGRTIKRALPSSLAESLRAVFAAFLWHEGIVHDAMACSSFLKFHPTLPKNGAFIKNPGLDAAGDQVSLSKEQRAQQRYSVEVANAGNYLNIRPSTLETLTKSGNSSVHNRRFRKNGTEEQPKLHALPELMIVCPPALKCLVYLWDQLSSNCIQVVQSAASDLLKDIHNPHVMLNHRNDQNICDDSKKNKKKKKEECTYCELCDMYIPIPVTYHMRSVHPGCGKPAKGKLFNRIWWTLELSSTGSGGIMNNQKRSPQQMPVVTETQLHQIASDLNKPSTSRGDINSSVRNSKVILAYNCSRDAAGKGPVSSTPYRRSDIPSCVSPELLWQAPDTFSCLESLGASATNDTPYTIFGLNSTDNGFERPLSEISIDSMDRSGVLTNSITNTNSLSRFHRSMSMGQGWPNQSITSKYMQGNDNVSGQNSKVILRRRNNSTCDDGGSLLLCHPSENLRKLVPESVFQVSSNVTTQNKIKTDVSLEPPENEQVIPNHVTNAKTKNSSFVRNENVPSSSADANRRTNRSERNSGTPYKSNNIDQNVCLLSRPSMVFIMEQHNLDKLRNSLKRSLRVATARIYSLQALNWLMRSVTQTSCLHDLMWWFVSSLKPAVLDDSSKNDETEQALEHPISSTQMCGKISLLLTQSFHTYLQTVADLTLLLPPWVIVTTNCHPVLWSHVFGNISKILSRSDEQNEEMLLLSSAAMLESNPNFWIPHLSVNHETRVSNLMDLAGMFEITVSSRQTMVGSLTDGSTETFWESDEEDRNKAKIIEISMNKLSFVCKMIFVHIDNSRDIQNKVTNVSFYAGPSLGDTVLVKSVEVDSKAGTWISTNLRDDSWTHFRLEFRGSESTLRVRQIKILGLPTSLEEVHQRHNKLTNAFQIQQRNCEAETLRVFRLITAQVFGKLILGTEHQTENVNLTANAGMESSATSLLADSLDLREHMVGILFSRSKLSHLQKQVIVHIVHAIRKETQRAKEEWEILNATTNVNNVPLGNVDEKSDSSSENSRAPDTYCFEMLSMVLALSGSTVGRSYLSHQYSLLKDLLSLLHTGSDRVQRQVTLLLRRILPEITPDNLADILGIRVMPPNDFSIVNQSSHAFDMNRLGIIDIFLAVIAKALQLQIKIKNVTAPMANKQITTVKLCNCIDLNVYSLRSGEQNIDEVTEHLFDFGIGENSSLRNLNDGHFGNKDEKNLNQLWFMKGSISVKQAENIIGIIRDMAGGKFSDKWSLVTKAAIAESILNLTRLEEVFRTNENCIKTATLWLALASLCVLDKDHVERLSSGQWSKSSETRPHCSNHDDGITPAVIQCEVCGSLCGDCDRFLHLNRKTRTHHRTLCKEEEEAIRVELHESCGRTKLFWLLALADSKTLKAMVEFRDGNNAIISGPSSSIGRCRFCGVTGNSGLLAIGNVCANAECQVHAANTCTRSKPCGHSCGGVINEAKCLPCLQTMCNDGEPLPGPKLTQDADDMCMICFVEALSCAPAIQLDCGHVFHYHCCKEVLQKGWSGPRITFGFSQCPICKIDITHTLLNEVLEPIISLKTDVRRKAMMRLEYEGIMKSTDHRDLTQYAMDRYAYYVCFKCKKAYYGGEARCDAEMGDKFDPEELVCGGCSDVARAQMCPKHGTDFLEYKCRYCCSVAVFFCFGTTHFCDTCHDDFQRLTNIVKSKLPRCPAGPKAKQLLGEDCPLHVVHPPTGEEFALGCGICRNAHTF